MSHALLLLVLALVSPVAMGLTVMIDAGHGGRDRGTERSGLSESAINLKVSQLLYERLKKDRRFKPHLTRQNDASISLAQRALAAKAKGADVLVSVHVNSSPDPRAKGAEFYFQNQLASMEESMFLAHQEATLETGNGESQPLNYEFVDQRKLTPDVASIVTDLLHGDRIWRSAELAKALKTNWRGTRKSAVNSIRQAPFFIVSQVTIPSSLVEIGFLTNDEDFKALSDQSELARMAEDLYRGLVQYKELMDKPVLKP